MGVGPPHGLDPAVQIIAHGPLFAGGLGVEVHQLDVGVQAPEAVVGHGEGIVRVGVHLAPADEVQNPHPQPAGGLVDPQPPAGDPAAVVGGPEQPGHIVQQVLDLDAVPGVVAQGDDVGPRLVDGLGLPGQDAQAGGVFPVDHSEVDLMKPLQGAQVVEEELQSLLSHHVAHGQHIEDHTQSSFFVESYYM